MQPFEWIDATSVEEAASLLAKGDRSSPVVAKAGGMDLMDLMKEGILKPARIVNLKSIPGLDAVGFGKSGGLSLGSLVTLAQIASNDSIRRNYPALAEAVRRASTPQVRNAATIGGNLLQRPRCWYFRGAHFHESNGDRLDYAREGENQYHAIFDNGISAMVHASTPATALVAYDAHVELAGPLGKRRIVALRDFFLPPDMTRDRETVIEKDEVLIRMMLPAPAAGMRAAYHKQTERESYDWPICDVAVVLQMDGPTARAASVALGWVAPTPRRATESEHVLTGKPISESVAREAARAAVAGATPLSKNAYKVPILEAVVRRTILAAA